MNQIAILLVGIFILFLVSLLTSKSDFFNPSFIVCTIFLICTLFALYAVTSWNINDSIFTPYGTVLILTGIIVFIVGDKLGRRLAPKESIMTPVGNTYSPFSVSNGKMTIILSFSVFTIAVYIYYVYRYVRANGYNGGFELGSIGDYYHQLTFAEAKQGNIPGFIKILYEFANAVIYIYMYIFLYNIILCKTKFKDNILFLIPVICYLPRVIVTSSRTNLIRLAGSTVLLIYIFMNRRSGWKNRKRNFKKILRISVISFVSVLVLFYLAVSNGWIGRSTEKTFFDAITVYLGAPIIHFYQFLSDPPADVMYFGQETFHGLNQIFVRLGLRDTYYSVQLELRRIGYIERGNVYTFFRRPLHDFGPFGMYLVTIITGFIYSYVYYGKLYRHRMTYKRERVLIIYGYWFYVIYLLPIMNNYCNYISVTMGYFLVGIYFIYTYLLGGIKFKKHK